MNQHRKIGWLGLAGAIAVAATTGGSALAADVGVIKIGSHTPPKASAVRLVTVPWMKQIEKDSGGTVKFQEFWGGQLIRSPRKQYEGMINGIQDASPILPSYTQKLFPDFGLFSLPFLFKGTGCEEAAAVGWQLYEKGLLGGLDKVFVAAIYTNDNGGMHFSRVLSSLDEIKGLKVRAAGPGESEVIEEMGATPVGLSITQVAESLNRGVINGTLAGWSALNTFRITPLIKTHVDMPFGVRAFFLGITKKAMAKLPAKGRAAVEKNSGLSLSKKFGALWAKEGAEMRKVSAKKRKVITPSEAQLARYAKTFKRFHQAWIKEADSAHRQKVYDATIQILAKLRGSS